MSGASGAGWMSREVRPRSMKTLLKIRSRRCAWYLLAFVLTMVAGLASRRFPQVLPACLGKYPGDVLWSAMVFFGLGAIFRTASSVLLSVGTLGFSFGIEVLKLCNAPWLASIRHTTLGHLVFGSVFSWQNLVAYFIGVIVGLMIEVFLMGNLRASGGRNMV
jgi:hypothetical protein